MEGTVTLSLNDYNKLMDEKEMTKMVCLKYMKRSKRLEKYLQSIIDEADQKSSDFACIEVEDARKTVAEARADLVDEEGEI